MFDIGFSEMMVIGVVALIVIGPERLPRVARTVGHMIGRLQRYVADVKADINREVELDELRKMRDTVKDAAASIETSVNAELHKAETELNSAAQSMAGDPPVPSAPITDAAAPAATEAAAPVATEAANPAAAAAPAAAEPGALKPS